MQDAAEDVPAQVVGAQGVVPTAAVEDGRLQPFGENEDVGIVGESSPAKTPQKMNTAATVPGTERPA